MSKEIAEVSIKPTPEFDWDALEASCTSSRKRNAKRENGSLVFCREPYAEEALKAYNGDFEDNNRVELVEVNSSYEGVVESINLEWCTINIGARDSVYVDMTKESEEYKDLLKVGEKLNVQIIESSGSKQGSYILGSVEAGFKRAVFDEILDSVENSKTAYNAIVRSLIPGGGYIVEIQGVECFMPGSLAGINKLHDFESILNTEMYVVPMNYSSDRGTIVVSHREYLKAMIPTKIDEIKEYDHGVVVRGCVTGSAKFGIFCEFNECLTGMIHVNDLDAETMKRHLNREVTPGEEIEFFIKKIISETKITLSQKPVEIVSDPWYNVSDKFKTPVEVTGKIRSVKEYGAFIDIGDGLVGLLHVSEFPTDFDLNDLNRGDDITVTVTRIDEETRKVFMEL
jgi:small subunit ribosomal protein S1|tara:strand:- start:260 stop:1453 length:1194 start_codon:yes stop_codon:yes gene_type:complete